jgi:uncharacterized membrane protein YphA (DoxX/SURF4 family)
VNVFLWILQILLAVVFLASGLAKVSLSRERLTERMEWVAHMTDTNVKLIGAAEALGALGLILPAATGIAPVLTPIAATALAVTMLGAIVVHVRLGDKVALMAPALVLLILNVIVAWGRFGPYHW